MAKNRIRASSASIVIAIVGVMLFPTRGKGEETSLVDAAEKQDFDTVRLLLERETNAKAHIAQKME